MRWHRFSHSKIKNAYKGLLTDFFIPKATKTYDSLDITYEILRHNKRKVDSDGITAWNKKWFTDCLTECNWLSDDDQVTHHLIPARQIEGLVETQLKVTVRTKGEANEQDRQQE